MALLRHMPQPAITKDLLKPWGAKWLGYDTKKKGDQARYFAKIDAVAFPNLVNKEVASALAEFLGGVEIIEKGTRRILPPQEDCVELGGRIVGAIRPQNFDVCYRPDGVRFAFDSKGLHDQDSIAKNYQNMLNDLGTEASTVHIRFPYALVTFMIVIPEPIFVSPQKDALTSALHRLSGRHNPNEDPHRAEAISLIVWDPSSGKISKDWPATGSKLRLEAFSEQVEKCYLDRYAGMPPHDPKP